MEQIYILYREAKKIFKNVFWEAGALVFFLAQEMSVKMAGSLNVVYGAGLKVD